MKIIEREQLLAIYCSETDNVAVQVVNNGQNIIQRGKRTGRGRMEREMCC